MLEYDECRSQITVIMLLYRIVNIFYLYNFQNSESLATKNQDKLLSSQPNFSACPVFCFWGDVMDQGLFGSFKNWAKHVLLYCSDYSVPIEVEFEQL